MDAYLSLEPKNTNRGFHDREVYALLETDKIVHGIQREVIAELIIQANDSHIAVVDRPIVRGTPVVEGQNAKIDCKFKTHGLINLEESEDGTIDFKELNIINNVRQGDLLAEKLPMREGVAGIDIYGEPVRTQPVRDLALLTGKYVQLDLDGSKCFAERDGHVFIHKRAVTLSPLFMVPHDVDLNTGNISFNGSVVVEGNVLAGFKIRARDSISVMGVVEGAELIAGGDIFIRGGIKGNDKAKVQCKGGFSTTFVESATVESFGKIQVTGFIVNSQITCHSKIILASGRASIVGGHTLAIDGIECLELGSKIGVATQITIGDKSIIRKRIEATSEGIEKIEAELTQINLGIKRHQRLFDNLKMLPEERRKPMVAVLLKKEELGLNLREVKAKKEKLTVLFNLRTRGRLKVRGTTHLNITMIIGHSRLVVRDAYINTVYWEEVEKKQIAFGPCA
jgi:uncharacterized protein